MPTISIILPVCNAEHTIRRSIQSVLDQTYTDYELIIMDDGSTDQTPQILDEMAASEPRIRVVHKTATGVSDSRNRALDLATGKYIQFLDADDYIVPMASTMFVHAMEDNPGCDMVISDFYRVIGEKKSVKGDIDEEKLITREEYAEEMMRNPADFYYGVLWNKFYRRSIIEDHQLRMDVNLSWSEDFIFNMEYVLHADQIYVLKYPTYNYVKTEGSLVESQGASISKTVRMKLAVIEYYSLFYKNIYTPGNYYLRSPQIYSFLLNFAKDGAINPFNSRLTVGQDRADVRFAPTENENPFVTAYYNNLLLEHTLEHIARGYTLDEKDVRILLYLKLAGGTADIMEIRNYTGLSKRALSNALSRLTHRKLIRRLKHSAAFYGSDSSSRSEKKANDAGDVLPAEPDSTPVPVPKPQVQYAFGEASSEIQQALQLAPRNIREILLQDFTPKEQETYTRLRALAAGNVRNALRENK